VRDHFFETLRVGFAPLLRSEGFRGSGRTFRRTRGEFLHIVNIQGSRHGDRCSVNLGVHLSFLPLLGGGGPLDPARIRECECEFRARLVLPGESDRWWPYGTVEEDSTASARDLIDLYSSEGRKHFERASAFPEPFASITPEDLERGDLSLLPGRTTAVRACLAMARISRHCGSRELARRFADIGLSRVGSAAALRAELEAVSCAA
jgi:hypothetical protein